MRFLLVVYDNGSYIHWFPQGLASIAAVLRREGVEVVVWNQDHHHYPDSALTAVLDQERFDAVGISVIGGYYQYRKLLALAEAVNAARQRPTFIIGGHGPAPEPAYFLTKTGADIAVIGEGEETVVDILRALRGECAWSEVAGIAYREGDAVSVNPRRPLIRDVDSIPWPAYDLFPVEYYRLLRMPHCTSEDFIMPVLSGRGCTFRCNFCYRMDKGFRPRSAEAIVEEIRYLKAEYGITYIAFSDELLMSSRARTEELCRAFLAAGLGIRWDCNGRLNYAEPDLLALMREAGCVFINYGIEAFDDQILENMKKHLTCAQIVTGIEATLASGISPGFNIIFGNIGENRRTLQQGVDFLLKYDDGAQMRTIRPVTPYPGCDLYYHAIREGLLEGAEDFYEHQHINSDLVAVNFTDMDDDAYHRALYEANATLIDHYFTRKREAVLDQARRLYHEADASFRGFRQS